MEITQAMRDYLYKKLEHVEKFIDANDESAMFNVELGKTTNHHRAGEVYRCEINLHLKGRDLRAESEMDDLYAAIDIAKDEIVREIQSGKERRISLARRGGAKLKNLVKGLFNK